MKNAGAAPCNCAVAGALGRPLLVTTTFTAPVALSDGACTLICVGLMYSTKADLPSIVTLTPSSETGRLLPVKSEVCQTRVSLARSVPWIITQEPDSIAGWKLAAFSTLSMTGVVAGSATVNFATKPLAEGPYPATIRLSCG